MKKGFWRVMLIGFVFSGFAGCGDIGITVHHEYEEREGSSEVKEVDEPAEPEFSMVEWWLGAVSVSEAILQPRAGIAPEGAIVDFTRVLLDIDNDSYLVKLKEVEVEGTAWGAFKKVLVIAVPSLEEGSLSTWNSGRVIGSGVFNSSNRIVVKIDDNMDNLSGAVKLLIAGVMKDNLDKYSRQFVALSVSNIRLERRDLGMNGGITFTIDPPILGVRQTIDSTFEVGRVTVGQVKFADDVYALRLTASETEGAMINALFLKNKVPVNGVGVFNFTKGYRRGCASSDTGEIVKCMSGPGGFYIPPGESIIINTSPASLLDTVPEMINFSLEGIDSRFKILPTLELEEIPISRG